MANIRFNSRQEAEREIVKKATADPAFRAALLANPKKALSDAFGIRTPDSFELNVMQETASHAYLVLPAAEVQSPDGALSQAELEAVAGGGTSEPGTWWPVVHCPC
ncbi:MAG: NHLP leader peptide family natural product precursor [Acidobacteria bacterium]|nr:MAG: NHLP leader peptide family natural product precursor [Acidobacteriota bacterium]